MAQMAVGKIPGLVFHTSITFEDTATQSSKKLVQLPAIQNGFICILLDTCPAVPDPTIYITLSSYINILGKYGTQNGGTSILRPNGTVGSDAGGSSYNTTTGVLGLGGAYAYYPKGMTYNIYALEMANED